MNDFDSDSRIHVWTDGSCDNREGHRDGGAAFYAHRASPLTGETWEQTGYCWFEDTSSSRMELAAIYLAMLHLSPLHDSPVTLHVDSSYAVGCVRGKWYAAWNANGWTNAAGEPVANRPLIEATYGALERQREFRGDIKIAKVKGHTGNHGNEYADQMAGDARRFRWRKGERVILP